MYFMLIFSQTVKWHTDKYNKLREFGLFLDFIFGIKAVKMYKCYLLLSFKNRFFIQYYIIHP